MDARARETGDSVKFIVIRPLSRALALYWHVNLGLAPQALCLRLLSQAKKQSFDFDFLCKAIQRSNSSVIHKFSFCTMEINNEY